MQTLISKFWSVPLLSGLLGEPHLKDKSNPQRLLTLDIRDIKGTFLGHYSCDHGMNFLSILFFQASTSSRDDSKKGALFDKTAFRIQGKLGAAARLKGLRYDFFIFQFTLRIRIFRPFLYHCV